MNQTAMLPVLKRTAKVVRTRPRRSPSSTSARRSTLEGAAAQLFGKMLPHLDGKTGVGDIAERIDESPAARPVAGRAARRRPACWPSRTTTRRDDDRRAVLRAPSQVRERTGCSRLRPPALAEDRDRQGLARPGARLRLREVPLHRGRLRAHGDRGRERHARDDAAPRRGTSSRSTTTATSTAKGCAACSPTTSILRAQPLPSTRALVNFLTESAARNSFGYYAGNELLQMTENTGDARTSSSIDDFYDAMRKHYPYTDKLIDSFIAHTNADQKLGHENVFLEMCQSVPPLTRAEVDDALNIVRARWPSTSTCSWTASTRFYDRFPTIPRLPATCFPSRHAGLDPRALSYDEADFRRFGSWPAVRSRCPRTSGVSSTGIGYHGGLADRLSRPARCSRRCTARRSPASTPRSSPTGCSSCCSATSSGACSPSIAAIPCPARSAATAWRCTGTTPARSASFSKSSYRRARPPRRGLRRRARRSPRATRKAYLKMGFEPLYFGVTTLEEVGAGHRLALLDGSSQRAVRANPGPLRVRVHDLGDDPTTCPRPASRTSRTCSPGCGACPPSVRR